tara:strand:- start:1746 stop:1850 length:105 start_codon:yes stop_codon:yes gene_type:complete
LNKFVWAGVYILLSSVIAVGLVGTVLAILMLMFG